MQRTEDQLVDEIEYVLMVRERKEKIEREIRNINEGKRPLSASNGWYGRLHTELKAEIDWKNGKRPQPKTTTDKKTIPGLPIFFMTNLPESHWFWKRDQRFSPILREPQFDLS